ncbi:TB2/DP1/HVA22-related protein family-containing protein [Strongyloides ratti]|uniref:Receptor expression-enhancing protein n=1 Tax=Strongyloides ratti TaxID=34506 RepID=A0A090MZB8_STRRB|nr:TB2/DP1/HVA22-related protein family-containing protein [Strongyloides ratti]CEF68659.1 TB2/DP1/HVA22-related protein family-containing protein [Strongyloides ratti]
MNECLLQKEIQNSLKIQMSKDSKFNRTIGKIGKYLNLLRHEVIYLFAALLSLYLLIGQSALLISRLMTVSLPLYYFFCNIKKKEKYETGRLLIYWPFYAFLHVLDYFLIHIENKIPCYVFLKTIFLIYLSSEWSRGSVRIYRSYIKPFLPISKYSMVNGRFSSTF